MYNEAAANALARTRGYSIAPDTGGWRRVVPSPRPVRLLEVDAIRVLVDAGIIVIAAGGGGVPVVLDEHGRPSGLQGVVDKDLAAVVLARAVNAATLLLLTDVDAVYRGFGGPAPQRIDRIGALQARALLAEGHAASGSMAPKLEAAALFAETGGTAIIAALDEVDAALTGRVGTTVEPALQPAATA
jgi:carbamate kinase